jgi:hypothetical protein
VPDLASELLETCRIAEDLWEHASERRIALRAEVDRLWKAYEAVRSGGRENVDDDIVDMVELSTKMRLNAQRATLGTARTEALLGAWRDAEHALMHGRPGSLSWLLACRAVEAARDAYHARVNAIDARSEMRDLSLSDVRDRTTGARAV